MVKLLLQEKADVNAQSNCHDDNFTPLYMAAQIGHQEIVTLLLVHGADPTLATKNGSTARDVSQQQGYTVVSELLDEYEKRLNTPVAAKFGSPDNQQNNSSLVSTPTTPSHHFQQFQRRRQFEANLEAAKIRMLSRGGLPPSVIGSDVIQSPCNYPSPVRPITPSRYLQNGFSGMLLQQQQQQNSQQQQQQQLRSQHSNLLSSTSATSLSKLHLG
ncbi:hypothetical protein HELRODRAFT_175272 [Helobdella robusta]|uniref:Uncharacterized protein n=1 Tax=Helobdella robusta TaxID=6412 RepID=T1F930_HELRO|nr:hypothetical protein HELRODRAFT_175272 [Helobdella robusta]ESO00791.1 hypothetical protein HELRODRAFT_175272 [Helobdella robusta]